MAHRDNYDDEYLAALKTALTGDQKPIFDYMYQCLSIIDGKSASLLQFNSITIAVVAVLMALLAQQPQRLQPGFAVAATLTVVLALLMLISSTMSLRVVWVYWAKTSDIVGDRYLRELLERRTRRTRWHEFSWQISFFCLPLFLADLLIVFWLYLR